MLLKHNQTMATAVEQLVIDPQSRFLEMKSLQPYSTTDEYLYAMKEDLADWLSNMYPDWQPITADNFLECLENGALLCHHANNVNDAARKMNSLSILTDCKFRTGARPQTFNARDNVSQFIKWARRIAGVREVLMFESDDLILRKNEKNFLLCLLEIARFGARFGVSVPAIIKLEDEIEQEIARDKQAQSQTLTELKYLQRKEAEEEEEKIKARRIKEIEDEKNTFETTNYQSTHNNDKQINQDPSNTFLSTNPNGTNWLHDRVTHISELSNNNNNNSKQRQNSEASDHDDSRASNEINTTTINLNETSKYTRTLDGSENPVEVPKYIRTFDDKENTAEIPKYTQTFDEREDSTGILKHNQNFDEREHSVETPKYTQTFDEREDSTGIPKHTQAFDERENPTGKAKYVQTFDERENPKYTQTFDERENPVEIPKYIRTIDDKENSSEIPKYTQTLDDREHPIEPPPSSSHLHKTVIKIANSCCCSQRFPVIRIGEGKYRIGENGAIIFIRILRNHVMVRVGGGWDTLENYLNKHDPCRRSGGHHRSDHHYNHNHSDIPILAIPNTNIAPSTQKTTPFGKSVTIRTDEFPLAKPSNHDTNLVDAQLVITRGADGRHRIGQITYKSEEDILNQQQQSCPHHHHHHHQSPPTARIKSARSTGHLTPSSIYSKQSSPSTDQDYSSLTETTPSKPSSSSSLDSKDDSIEQSFKSLNITSIENERVRNYSPVVKSHTQPLIHTNDYSINQSDQQDINNFNNIRSKITESIIGNIDDNIHPTYSGSSQHDFDLSDIEDVMELHKNLVNDKDITTMDNDSLESSEGIVEETKKLPPVPTIKKSVGSASTLSAAQKQKQTTNRKNSTPTSTSRYSPRLNLLPNVAQTVKKEEPLNKQRRKSTIATQRSKSSELVDKITDTSKLDRDSGFDEQDFRTERLHSIGDDNSSVSSMRSAKSSTILHSNKLEYKETKSYELRMKKLDAKRILNEKTQPKLYSTARRASDMIPPTPPIHKYRKNSQSTVNLKQQQP
ncbi:unnamed protein product [Adineta steineri]|uniref:Uncharacterized protein n=2 Tax=Adineta steineri TaxID=433720 RepID=A0A819N265_9BILA|nr:unnamed protein product [Adineta steineri]